MRMGKGKSIMEFPNDYCIIDIETTGLDYSCKIIEVSAIKVRNDNVCEQFSQLVNPGLSIVYKFCDKVLTPIEFYIPDFIQDLTGITDDMVKNQPTIDNIIPELAEFIGDDLLVGHNIVSFDSNFLFDDFMRSGRVLPNNLIDTLRLSRWILPNLEHHRLEDLSRYYKIPVDVSHRGLEDCKTTYKVFMHLKNDCIKNFGDLNSFYGYVKSRLSKSKYTLKSKDITTEKTEFDVSNPLYGSVCVFTGTLEKMPRRRAMQIVKDLGGECGDSVTQKTNYLILGNNDFKTTIKDGKSTKQKKAEKLQLEGNDIQIISENVFYEMANID